MPSQEEIDDQKELLAEYRRTLSYYLRQQAQHSIAYTPPVVDSGIREMRANIDRIKVVLRGWEVEVEDQPNDVNAPLLDVKQEVALRQAQRALRIFKLNVRSLYTWTALVGVITIIILILPLLYFTISNISEKKIYYLIIDSSQNLGNRLREAGLKAKLTTISFPERSEVGMAVYGSGLSGNLGCNDIVQLVSPSTKQDGVPQISQAIDLLTEIKTNGYGGMQNALLYAFDELSDYRGKKKIVIMTSGIDSRCGKLNRVELNQIAHDKGVDYELAVIPVGNLSDEDRKMLQDFSEGRYFEAKTSEDVPIVINEAINSATIKYETYK